MENKLIQILDNCRFDFLSRNSQLTNYEQFCEEIESFADYYCACNNFTFAYSSIIVQILIYLLLMQNELDGKSSEEIINIAEQNLDLKNSGQICDYFEVQNNLGNNDIDELLFELQNEGINFHSRNKLNKGFEITQIKDYIDKAKKDKDIQKLAEIIGKHGGRTEKKQNFTDSFKPAVAYDGITYSDDIRNIVPSELALHRNKTTNLFFLEKLADKQLQTYKLGNDKSYSNNGLKKKGPIIVCIDTSGSMEGEPEKIAKTMVVAIVMIAKKEKRSAFIINFSDTYESLEIGTKDSLEKLVSFLSKSFHGGTNIINALKFAVDNQNNDFDNADILLVSDFEDYITYEDKKFIFDNKNKGTCFYGLIAGNAADANEELKNLMDIAYHKESIL